jgi:Ca2+/Na+ antiporter
MKISEIFKSPSFVFGFILGLGLIYLIVTETLTSGFKSEFIFYYLVILALTLVTTGEEGGSHMFFVGLGIPYLIVVLLIFYMADRKHKKEGKGYRKWKW